MPMITPFKGKEAEELDQTALEKLTSFLIGSGINALMVNGTSGEFLMQTVEERKRAVRVVVRVSHGKTPVIAGISESSTKNAVSLGLDAVEANADAVIATGPIYYKTNDAGLYEHFQKIIDEVHLPLMIYNIPSWVGYNIPASVVKRLVDKNPGRVAGVKFTTNDMGEFLEYLRLLKDRISVMIGSDPLIYPALEMGAAGAVVGSANVLPRETLEIYDHFMGGKAAKSKEIQDRIDGFTQTMVLGTYPAGLKEALRFLGLECGRVRPPLVPLLPEEVRKVRQSLSWKRKIR